jgi:hypothetical protein
MTGKTLPSTFGIESNMGISPTNMKFRQSKIVIFHIMLKRKTTGSGNGL